MNVLMADKLRKFPQYYCLQASVYAHPMLVSALVNCAKVTSPASLISYNLKIFFVVFPSFSSSPVFAYFLEYSFSNFYAVLQ